MNAVDNGKMNIIISPGQSLLILCANGGFVWISHLNPSRKKRLNVHVSEEKVERNAWKNTSLDHMTLFSLSHPEIQAKVSRSEHMYNIYELTLHSYEVKFVAAQSVNNLLL